MSVRRPLVLAWLALMVSVAVSWWSSSPQPPDLLAVTLTDLEGKEVRFDRWRGKVILVNFWATWCGPCRMEIPWLERWQQEYGQAGLQVVGIAVDTREAVRNFWQNHRVSYPVLLGGGEAVLLMEKLGNQIGALPFTVVLDRKGNIRFRHIGTLFEALFQDKIRPLL